MKKVFIALFTATTLLACNNTSDKTTDTKTIISATSPGKSFVSADIDGKPWKSDGDNVKVVNNTILDILSVHTTDNAGKKDIVFDLPDFSKTKIGSYSTNSAAGKGISVLDTDKADNDDMDLNNYQDKDVADWIKVTNIKDMGDDNRLVEGTFASEMIHSYDGASKPKVQLTNGKFSVVYNTKRSY
ncbi:MAG: hypothetical protein ABIO05_05395 [Ferruginibacter sp.]